MMYLFLSLLIMFLALPFGYSAFVISAVVVSLLIYLEIRKMRVFMLVPLSLLSIIYLPLALLTVIYLLWISKDELFMRIISFIAAFGVFLILFPVLYLFVISPPLGFSWDLVNTIVTSMVAATIATLIGLGLSLPLGYLLARRNFALRSFVEGVIDLPIVIPHTVAGIILLLVFGSSGIIGAPLESIGIRFYYALPGIVIAMLFVSIPFLINQIRDGIARVDERYELVAMNLGATRTRAFFTVVLPLIKKNVLSGSINAWARAMSEFGAVIMIAFYPMIAPTYIYFLFTNYGLSATLPATSFLLMITLLIFVSLRAVFGRLNDAGD